MWLSVVVGCRLAVPEGSRASTVFGWSIEDLLIVFSPVADLLVADALVEVLQRELVRDSLLNLSISRRVLRSLIRSRSVGDNLISYRLRFFHQSASCVSTHVITKQLCQLS